MAQQSEQAGRVLDLAGRRPKGSVTGTWDPEHLVLGVLRDGGGGPGRALEAFGITLEGARAALRHLADRGVVPGPRPSDAELLGSLGMGCWCSGWLPPSSPGGCPE